MAEKGHESAARQNGTLFLDKVDTNTVALADLSLSTHCARGFVLPIIISA